MVAPTEIGPYRVVRPLGQGGMGAVYLAHDTRLQRQVALKFVLGGGTGEFARQELLREARAAAALNHPHIASVHDVLDVDGQIAIVFEYVEGETLAARLAGGALAIDQALGVAGQLAEGLAAAHQHGVVHRDLKPANVGFTPDGQVKILDFGVARVMPGGVHDAARARTTVASFVGTVGYAAPEQCLGQSVDARADVFSFGVVLFEMLTGRRPFAGVDAPTVVRAMLNETPPRARTLVPGVPAEVDALIARMLSADRTQRPEHLGEVLAVLRGAAPTVRDHWAPPPGRRPWTIAAVIGAAVITGALVSSLAWDRQPPWEATVAARAPVVAVLRLTNASGDPAKDYVATGVAENLVTQLAAIPSIAVLSRATVGEAERQHADVASLATALDATYLVDGSVQQSGGRLRIDLRLVEPTGTVAWADDVEGDLDQVFALQRRLTGALAQALSVRLSAADRASLARQPTASPEALDAYWRGRALLERRDVKGNIDAALAALDHALALDPRFADAHAARGEALWARYEATRVPADAQLATAASTDALRYGPNQPGVRYLLALTLSGTGRDAEAVDELQRALLLRPNYDDARRELGETLARLGRLREAIAEIQKAIALRPGYWGHYNTLGRVLLQGAHYADAAAAFQRVVNLQPDSFIGYAQLGSTYYFAGQYDHALSSYQRAIALGADARIWSNVGAIHHLRGEYDKAAASYAEVLKHTPNVPVVHRNLGDALSRLGRRAHARDAYARAASLAEDALAINPSDATMRSQLGVYRAKLGQCDAALAAMRQAQASRPDDASLLLRQAVVYTLCDQPDAALRTVQLAAERGVSRQLIAQDDDLRPLRRFEAFQQLIRTLP